MMIFLDWELGVREVLFHEATSVQAQGEAQARFDVSGTSSKIKKSGQSTTRSEAKFSSSHVRKIKE